MSIVVLKLPDVKRKKEERPRCCPYCQGETFQRWGRVNKPVKDVHVRQVRVYRYKCCQCRRTFRHYPQGNSRADQTEGLRMLTVLLWALGLSHRSASLILGSLKASISFMTIWRNVQAEAQVQKKNRFWKPVRVVGLDGAYVLGWGNKQPVLVAVDLGTGEPIALGYVNEHNPQALQRWLAPLVQRHGISVIVSDDLFSYKLVADKLHLEHQVCQFLPPDGNKKLYALWKQLPGRRSKPNQARLALEQLRDLLMRLSQDWQRYCVFQSEPQVPWTNNPTERAIGKMKMRARTVRGYKSWQGMQAGLLVTGLLAR